MLLQTAAAGKHLCAGSHPWPSTPCSSTPAPPSTPCSAYNKPVAIIDWLAKNDVKEDYVLVIDADMVMREPFLPEVGG